MKKGIVIIAIASMIVLTGCIQKSKLSDNERGVTAEYIAGVVLNNDENYKAELIEPSVTPTPTVGPSITPKPSILPEPSTNVVENNNGSTTTDRTEIVSNSSLAEVIGAENFNVKYLEYQLCETYPPEDDMNTYFSLTAREGAQLLVASFSIENATKKAKSLDTDPTEIKYQLDINTGTISGPLATLLENDMRYIDVTLKSGEKKEFLLIFEVSKKVKMSNINLILSRDDKTEIIKMK